MLVLITLVWGTNWPIMKFGVTGFPALTFRTLCMWIGLPLLGLFLWWRRVPFRIGREHWPALAWLTVFNMLFWHTLAILAIQTLSSGRAAILGYTMPVFSALVGAWWFGQRLAGRAWIGVAAAAQARGRTNSLAEATRVVMYDENGQQVELPQARISAVGPASILEGGAKADEVSAAETFEEGQRPANIIEAAAQGTQTGVKLAVAVGAMVMVFVALVALANGLLAGIGGGIVGLADQAGAPLSPEAAAWLSGISFQKLLGYLFAPVMFLIGISDWDQAQIAGGLFGTKIVLNEFVAFIDLGNMQAGELTERSRAIVTFALCGFANFSSIAIQMAVTGGLAPNQRPVIAKLGLKALAAGSLANLMSAALASLFLPL